MDPAEIFESKDGLLKALRLIDITNPKLWENIVWGMFEENDRVVPSKLNLDKACKEMLEDVARRKRNSTYNSSLRVGRLAVDVAYVLKQLAASNPVARS
jgi:hypothetical protein